MVWHDSGRSINILRQQSDSDQQCTSVLDWYAGASTNIPAPEQWCGMTHAAPGSSPSAAPGNPLEKTITDQALNQPH